MFRETNDMTDMKYDDSNYTEKEALIIQEKKALIIQDIFLCTHTNIFLKIYLFKLIP